MDLTFSNENGEHCIHEEGDTEELVLFSSNSIFQYRSKKLSVVNVSPRKHLWLNTFEKSFVASETQKVH